MESRVLFNYKEFAFLLKTEKNNQSLASDWWEYIKSCFKENARTFCKNSTSQENFRFSRLKKRLRGLYKKENFKPEIEPMIENLQDELYQLENKQAKGAKLRANIRFQLDGEKCSKNFSKVLERHNLQNQTISELYTDDNKSKYSSNSKYILKSAKKMYETLYSRETTSKVAITEFLRKISSRKKKGLINNLTFVRRKYLYM